MLSDEEKKAVEWLKRLVKINKRDNLNDTFAEILLNFIEKQSKEIEELKEENEKYKNPPFFDEDNYISKKESEQKEKKAYIDGTNAADKLCNKKWEDKIKAKIEEYKKQIEKMEKDDVGIGFTLGKEWSDLKVKVEFGQSLLEKE